MRSSVYLAIGLWLAPSLAPAHPGHGATEPSSWTHYLTEPLHVGVLAAVTVAAVLSLRALRNHASRDRSD